MSTNFQIDFKKSKGYLHIIPRGDLDGSSAWELVNLLDEQYDGKGRVVIDTQNLREMCPFGCSTFRCRLKLSRLPSNRLSFRGEKGYEIAPEGSKVVVSHNKRWCRCDGNCANCLCAGEKSGTDKRLKADAFDKNFR
ncbi:MAG: hypothetical protein P8Z73_03750 [Desulfobacteraceae bacterium]|jgi:hypothetical protein